MKVNEEREERREEPKEVKTGRQVEERAKQGEAGRPRVGWGCRAIGRSLG